MRRSADHHSGEVILSLLEEFPLGPISDVIRNLYHEAYETRIENPRNAIRLCEAALEILKNVPEGTFPNKKELKDAIEAEAPTNSIRSIVKRDIKVRLLGVSVMLFHLD